MLKRREVLKTIFRKIKNKKAIVISTTGLIGRECVELAGYNQHFYMAGSMGLTSSIGLGIAASKSNVKVIAIDGDGSFLMNLGGICAIGSQKPKNFIHIVLDNGCYYSTGGMKTYSKGIKLEKVVKLVGYRKAFACKNVKELEEKLESALKTMGPVFLRVYIAPQGKRKLPRPHTLRPFHFNLKKELEGW